MQRFAYIDEAIRFAMNWSRKGVAVHVVRSPDFRQPTRPLCVDKGDAPLIRNWEQLIGMARDGVFYENEQE